MIDIILVTALVAIAGFLLWMERFRHFAPAGLDFEESATRARETGYFWRLARPAGLSPDQAWPYYLGAKVALTLVLPISAWVFMGFGVVGLLLIALIGFLIPDALLAYVRRQRQATIRRSMSFFLDLIVSLLQAGLTLEEAFRRAAREGLPKGHALAEEASQVVDELDFGRDRTAGFQALADRTGVRELRGLANALALGLGLGSPVEATLRAQAELARAKRREEGLRSLQVAGAEILIPLLLCGFPVFVVMVFFPLGLLALGNLEALGRALR